jgi:glycosyltransferase involved in cell wall biosynthesis
MELLKKKYFDLYFITSPFDKRYLEEKIGSKINNLIVLPIGVNENLLKRKGTKKEEDWISFFGKMNYKPNEDAVIYFSNKIFPRIKRSLPTVRFYIVGTDPSQKVKNLEKIKDIKVTGFLEDPYSLLEKSKLIAVPLRFGAGMQTKVLESMALGKPVVSSYIGARAILAKEKGIEIITDDNPELWSKKIIDLFNNPKKRSEIGKIGKKIIINNYRWEIIGKKLLSEIKRIIN